MSLHPEGKNALHPKYTSSQKALHLTSHFIPYATSSYTSLHPTGHFILYVTSYYDSQCMSHLIQQVTSSQSTFHALSYFSTSSHRPLSPHQCIFPFVMKCHEMQYRNVVPGNQLKIYIRSDPSPTLYGCHQDTSSPTSVTNIDLIIVEICKGRLNSENFMKIIFRVDSVIFQILEKSGNAS